MSGLFMEIMRFIVAGGDPRAAGSRSPRWGTRSLWGHPVALDSLVASETAAPDGPWVPAARPTSTQRTPSQPFARCGQSLGARNDPSTGAAFRARVAKLALVSPPAWVLRQRPHAGCALFCVEGHTPAPYRETLEQTRDCAITSSSPCRTACTRLPMIPRKQSGSASQAGRHGSGSPATRQLPGGAVAGPRAAHGPAGAGTRSAADLAKQQVELAPWSR